MIGTVAGSEPCQVSNAQTGKEYAILIDSSDRDQDFGDNGLGIIDQGSQPPKRPRIIRNRYNSGPTTHGLAKKLLPIDPQVADKTRTGRNN